MSRIVRRALQEQSGLGLVEALVAAILVTLASLAVMAAFDTSRRATFRAEQSQVATDRAQREIEAIRQLPYAEIALTSMPVGSGDSSDPRSRVNGSRFALEESGADKEELVVQGGVIEGEDDEADTTIDNAAVDPGPTPFTSGDISGAIYRFIVWRDDPNCDDDLCEGEQDLKRIIVVVRIDPTSSGGTPTYIEVQSDVVDPQDSNIGNSEPPELGEQIVAQQFWLSDERCTNTGEPPHTDPLVSHPVRNTLGHNCKSGTADRPDALLTEAPINFDPTPDFATDLDLEPLAPALPTDDAGLQFRPGGSDGCKFKPTGAEAYKEAHIWVSKKLPFNFQMTGGASLELWTRTTNGITTPGRICATVFTRLEDPLGLLPPTDTRMTDLLTGNKYYTAELNPWPPGPKWTRVRIPMSFAPATALLGQRFGVQLAIEKAGTPSRQLEFLYDEILHESRLEIETTTPFTS